MNYFNVIFTGVVSFCPQNWIFGVMHLKVWLLILLAGPRWYLRDQLHAIHAELLRHWPDVRTLVILKLSASLFAVVGANLSVPFLFAYYCVAPALGKPTHFTLLLCDFSSAFGVLFEVCFYELSFQCEYWKYASMHCDDGLQFFVEHGFLQFSPKLMQSAILDFLNNFPSERITVKDCA